MRSITLKMVLAFLGIALISIVLIVVLARWNTGTEFSRFVVDRRGSDLVESLANYYQANGSWEAVGNIIVMDNTPPRQENGPPLEPFFTLVDHNGQVVFAGPGYHMGI